MGTGMADPIKAYMEALQSTVLSASATTLNGASIPIDAAVLRMGSEMKEAHNRGNRILFVGNGGSASICSHMATDYSKNGGMRALAFNDGAVLTCLGNDYGYEHVFEKQVEWHANKGDVLVAISSSGKSKNILNAVKAGRERACSIFTLSGFSGDNPLRTLGDLNIFLNSHEYGFVEVGHLALLHSVLDIQLGWQADDRRGLARNI
jgi:D-sedoheptulose 7-phosphate isomerase